MWVGVALLPSPLLPKKKCLSVAPRPHRLGVIAPAAGLLGLGGGCLGRRLLLYVWYDRLLAIPGLGWGWYCGLGGNGHKTGVRHGGHRGVVDRGPCVNKHLTISNASLTLFF